MSPQSWHGRTAIDHDTVPIANLIFPAFGGVSRNITGLYSSQHTVFGLVEATDYVIVTVTREGFLRNLKP